MKILLLLPFVLSILTVNAQEINYAKDLASEANAAGDESKIFLLYVSRPACPYCEKLKQDVLFPLVKGKRFDHILRLREVSLADNNIIGFDGVEVSAGRALSGYKIVGTPTLLFLDRHGRQLTENLSGYFLKDFYWSYLEANIKKAQAKLISQLENEPE